MPLAYGRLVPLHRAFAEAGLIPGGGGADAGQGSSAAAQPSPAAVAASQPLPLESVPLSSGNVDPEGLYLLENGAQAWLYFGAQAPPQLVHDLLGTWKLTMISSKVNIIVFAISNPAPADSEVFPSGRPHAVHKA